LAAHTGICSPLKGLIASSPVLMPSFSSSSPGVRALIRAARARAAKRRTSSLSGESSTSGWSAASTTAFAP
jgi:hypothetical protein